MLSMSNLPCLKINTEPRVIVKYMVSFFLNKNIFPYPAYLLCPGNPNALTAFDFGSFN